MNTMTSTFFAEQYLAGASLMVIALLFLWLGRMIALTLAQATPPRRQHSNAPLLEPLSAPGLLPTRQERRWRDRRPAITGKAWKPGL